MNSVALEEAIRARLVSSMTSASVTVQGVWSTVAPDDVEFKQGANPYIVFDLQIGEMDDTFNQNGIRAVYRVNIYDHIENNTTNAEPAYEAMVGNGTPSSAPTRGLHRWDATVSGLNVSQCEMQSFGYGHGGDVLHYWATFEIYACEA